MIMAGVPHLCKRSTSTNTLREAPAVTVQASQREALADDSHLRWSQPRQHG